VISISNRETGINEGSRKIENESRIAIDKLAKAVETYKKIRKNYDEEVRDYHHTPMYQLPDQIREIFNFDLFIEYEADWSLERINRYSNYWEAWGLEIDEYCPLMKISAINSIKTLSGFTTEKQKE
jgi:hypothetical protein